MKSCSLQQKRWKFSHKTLTLHGSRIIIMKEKSSKTKQKQNETGEKRKTGEGIELTRYFWNSKREILGKEKQKHRHQ